MAVGALLFAGGARASTPFQRGDVFVAGSGGVSQYSAAGALKATIPGTAGANAICFDPSGSHLILPGVGLFDGSGNPVASSWASVANGDRCVADGLGHVYVSAQTPAYSITKYDITGHALQTFPITDPESHALAIDLAPDECTIYYGSFFAAPGGAIRRLNGCTGDFDPTPFNTEAFVDDLRVLPDRSVIVTDDTSRGARLYDASGQFVRSYRPPNCSGGSCTDSLRTMALDPDEQSFRMCCLAFTPTGPQQVLQFDVAGGTMESQWTPAGGAGAIAVYDPPLVGDANVEGTRDSNKAGTAEAFTATAGSTGQVTRLHLYVDATSTATSAVIGVYSDRNGHPRSLLTRSKISGLSAGSWNYADVPTAWLAAGRRYWIAVLGPKGSGTLRFRDAGGRGGRSEKSKRKNLTRLPATWASGAASGSAPVSAFGS
jgi:hypothetical protein